MELILSLDTKPTDPVEQLLNQIKNDIHIIKVGHILFGQNPQHLLPLLADFKIFLDFKFFDIPNTVSTAISQYAKMLPNLTYYTIHGTAEDNMIKACVRSEVAIPLSVISLSSNKGSSDTDFFLYQVERNIQLGIRHFVCPPNQVLHMKQNFGSEIKIFVPGIRNEDHAQNDHFSTMSIAMAKANGVDFAIMGRPIIDSANPSQTIKNLLTYC